MIDLLVNLYSLVNEIEGLVGWRLEFAATHLSLVPWVSLRTVPALVPAEACTQLPLPTVYCLSCYQFILGFPSRSSTPLLLLYSLLASDHPPWCFLWIRAWVHIPPRLSLLKSATGIVASYYKIYGGREKPTSRIFLYDCAVLLYASVCYWSVLKVINMNVSQSDQL